MSEALRRDIAASPPRADVSTPLRPADADARSPGDARLHIGLLTGGDDRPYALGMASALASQGIRTDFVGSDALDAPQLHATPGLVFMNLRGDQSESAPLSTKTLRILTYYIRLARYAAGTKATVLHILWNNRFEFFDRTLLMLYYRLLGRRIVFTAHNVNAARRDGCDSWLNRLTLRAQYRLCSHILVHTEKMKRELLSGFRVHPSRVTVIPFGINDTIPKTRLTHLEARKSMGIDPDARTVLFFGQIAPYKGLDYLVEAIDQLEGSPQVHLVVAGKVKRGYEGYWAKLRERVADKEAAGVATMRIGFIPDDEIERYFKVADAVVLPYREIFQSGVPFLAYSFGVPVIASDVGSLREDIEEGVTGFLCPPHDPAALADAIGRYFASDIYRTVQDSRQSIRARALERHSWENVGRTLRQVYEAAARN